jgi:hypothetical protein
MRREAAVGLIILASLAGCAQVRPSSPVAASEAPPAARPSPPSATPTSPPAPPESTSGTTAATAVVAPAATDVPNKPDAAAAPHAAADRIAPASGSAEGTSGRARATTPAAAAKPAAPPAPPAPKAAAASAAPDPRPASPSLDLTALEQRLRDTHAIGLFTKLSLKNQVDDLLGQVRAYYRGHGTSPPLPLRPRYDGLLLKVLSVLQDGDPPLAAQIWSSREAIWGVLADPAKVEKILG